MEEDCGKLLKMLNITFLNKCEKIRENIYNSNKYLSSIAIDNLYKYYNNTDFKILQLMVDKQLISQQMLQQSQV